ncbi:hypothetical protein EPI10_021564 [Gossypium australe]|uniref:Uncharacterized protein n=1 Tax=Gossypium australe TaxID=47621 RepID=A0A5B6WHA2_9ROSI|nr:hypothetical protein EPI10_021564 [Gossypium australe]
MIKGQLVYVDGSAAKAGLEAIALLIDPSNNEWQYELSFGTIVNTVAISERSGHPHRFIVGAQLLTRFDKVQIKQLPMSDNTHADALSKLASSIVIE